MQRGLLGVMVSLLSSGLLALGVPTSPVLAVPSSDQQNVFMADVKKIVGTKAKGWKSPIQIRKRGEEICGQLAKSGYSSQALEFAATELSPRSWLADYPLPLVKARRVVTSAVKNLCPMPPAPPVLEMPAGWVRESPMSFDGPFDERYEYVGEIAYGRTIPIGNLAQIPATTSRIVEIDCTGEWYRRSSFGLELVDAAGTVLFRGTGTDDGGRVTSCAGVEIDEVFNHPTATGIHIPNSIASLDGYPVSGPGVSLSVHVQNIPPADYCDPGATSAERCRFMLGDVYFPNPS